MAADHIALITAAADRLNGLSGLKRHDVAIVLGSGWEPAIREFKQAATVINCEPVAFAKLPGFTQPGVEGHPGLAHSLRIGEAQVLLFAGRTHLYEGHGEQAVAHAVRVAAAMGCRIVMLTNAAGGISPGLGVGQPVLISDHINLTMRSPLTGPSFVDLTDLYSPRLRNMAREIESTLTEGVYASLPGPHYETPAEIRALRVLGADLVGMSTALEAIAARAAGMEVFAVSLVSNLAAGVSGKPLDHAEVVSSGLRSAHHIGALLVRLLSKAIS